jgi:CheY-like chemotaxis protein
MGVVPLFAALFVVLEIRRRTRAALAQAAIVRMAVPPPPPPPPLPHVAAEVPGSVPDTRSWLRRSLPNPGRGGRGKMEKRHIGAGFVAPAIEEAAAAGTLILVVVNNLVEQGRIARALAHAGYAADFAADSRSALESLAARPHGLLLVDCLMPGADGYQLARQVRAGEEEGGPHLAVVGLLGYMVDPQARARCGDAGMDEAITKAGLVADIETVVARWLPAAASLRRRPGEDDPATAVERKHEGVS